MFVLGIAKTQAQALAFGLGEPHEVRTVPPLQPVQAPLDPIPSLQGINHTQETQRKHPAGTLIILYP